MSLDLAPMDVTELRMHIEGANPATLLASVVTITGDAERFEAFQPHITHEFDGATFHSALPEDKLHELQAWAMEVYEAHDGGPATADNIDDELFARIASTLAPIPVDASSSFFLREQGGFKTFVQTVPRTRKAPEGFKLLVVGAGMSGIAMSILADREGIDFEVLESRPDLGGVWWQNTYPGVGVDTQSVYYSFSFETNPDWTHLYPEGDQYLRYLHRVADTYGVLDRFQFGAEVTGMRWDDDRSVWHVDYVTSDGPRTTEANVVVTAAGYLSGPQLPDVPGLDSFAGQWWHSSEWRHDVDLQGKRVAVVGTGCTSVQIVDAVTPDTASMTVFQRQPHWIMPSAGRDPHSEAHRWLNKNFPGYVQWNRLLAFIPSSDVNFDVVRYDAEWAAEHELSISAANDAVMQVGLQYLEDSFADRPDLKAKVTPTFAPFGKRIVRDPGTYYETLKQDKTTLVTCGIREVVPEGIVDGDGRLHECDVIVYATGFKFNYLSHWDIVGRDGHRLEEVWRERPVAYNGLAVPDFPNLFITSGPNASPGHGGGHTFMVEATTHYIIEAIQTLFEHDARTIAVTPEAQQAWQDEMDEMHADSIWGRELRATTYYRNEGGHVVLANPFRFEDYWTRLRQPNLDEMVVR